MGSSLVPIMLIVVLLVGAVVFIVLSSRSGRSDYDAGRPTRQHRRRRRSGTVPTRVDKERSTPDSLVPGFGSAPSAARHDAETARGGDVTARYPATGGTGPAEPGRRRPGSDPDETGWTEPPTDPPPTVPPAPAREPADARTVLVGPSAGHDSPYRPEPAPLWDDDQTSVVGGPSSVGGPSPESAGGLVAEEPVVATAPALRLAAAGRTRRGKRGGPNEDAFVVADGLLAVADGVGGEAAGQIASTLAVTTVAQFRPQYASDPRDGLRRAVERANKVVREKPQEQPTWLGMACTLDVVVLGRLLETADTLTVAHVGDSSVWLQPSRGRPRRLTTPHAIKNGPLLNAVGLGDEIEADLLQEPVQAGDRVVLASDGITKVMTPEQLDGLMTELGNEPPERAADALVEAAMLAGARDDTTIVVADLVPDNTAR